MKLPFLAYSSSSSRSMSISSFVRSSVPSRTFLFLISSKVIDCWNGPKDYCAIVQSLNFNLSYPRMPTSVKRSHTTIVFILLSKTEDELSDGQTLTSRTHGLRLLSIIISKPYSSKQLFLVVGFLDTFNMMLGSTEISVFRTIAFIYQRVAQKLAPILL